MQIQEDLDPWENRGEGRKTLLAKFLSRGKGGLSAFPVTLGCRSTGVQTKGDLDLLYMQACFITWKKSSKEEKFPWYLSKIQNCNQFFG